MKSFLIIPMGGRGNRFLNAGYKTYKPFLPVDNKNIILDNIIIIIIMFFLCCYCFVVVVHLLLPGMQQQ